MRNRQNRRVVAVSLRPLSDGSSEGEEGTILEDGICDLVALVEVGGYRGCGRSFGHVAVGGCEKLSVPSRTHQP